MKFPPGRESVITAVDGKIPPGQYHDLRLVIALSLWEKSRDVERQVTPMKYEEQDNPLFCEIGVERLYWLQLAEAALKAQGIEPDGPEREEMT